MTKEKPTRRTWKKQLHALVQIPKYGLTQLTLIPLRQINDWVWFTALVFAPDGDVIDSVEPFALQIEELKGSRREQSIAAAMAGGIASTKNRQAAIADRDKIFREDAKKLPKRGAAGILIRQYASKGWPLGTEPIDERQMRNILKRNR